MDEHILIWYYIYIYISDFIIVCFNSFISLSKPECIPATWLYYDTSCCTDEIPCRVGEGGCDKDSQCKGDLFCGSNNCGSEFPSSADCCYASNVIWYVFYIPPNFVRFQYIEDCMIFYVYQYSMRGSGGMVFRNSRSYRLSFIIC